MCRLYYSIILYFEKNYIKKWVNLHLRQSTKPENANANRDNCLHVLHVSCLPQKSFVSLLSSTVLLPKKNIAKSSKYLLWDKASCTERHLFLSIFVLTTYRHLYFFYWYFRILCTYIKLCVTRYPVPAIHYPLSATRIPLPAFSTMPSRWVLN